MVTSESKKNKTTPSSVYYCGSCLGFFDSDVTWYMVQLYFFRNKTFLFVIPTTFIPVVKACLNVCLNELIFCKVSQNQMLKISAFYLDKQDFLFLKNMKCTMYHGQFFLQPTDAILCLDSFSINGSESFYSVTNNKSCASAAQYAADLN